MSMASAADLVTAVEGPGTIVSSRSAGTDLS